jgi:beta-N-acetylhexosaminidase
MRIAYVLLFTLGLTTALLFSGRFFSFLPQRLLARVGPFTSGLETPTPKPTMPLTTPQKIAQLLAISLTLKNEVASDAAEVKKIQELTELEPGFVVLFGKKLSFQSAKNATDQLATLPLPIPIAIAVDHEGGIVQRLSGPGFTPVDSWNVLCQTSTETRKEIFTKSASELKAAGIHIVLGPVVDSATSSSEILKTRLCPTNSDMLIQSAAEVIEIYQQARITPVLKHYPGIGSVTTDLHRTYSEVSDVEREMPIFHTLLKKYPTVGVMTAHAGLPGNNLPCSLSADCIKDLLQYPDALIITDDMNMKATARQNSSSQAEVLTQLTQQAIEAKNTVVLLGPDVNFSVAQTIVTELSRRYDADVTFAAIVDESLTKITTWKNQQFH